MLNMKKVKLGQFFTKAALWLKPQIIDFIKSAKNPYMFKCNGRKIKIAFSNNDEIAENKLKDTVNKIYK